MASISRRIRRQNVHPTSATKLHKSGNNRKRTKGRHKHSNGKACSQV